MPYQKFKDGNGDTITMYEWDGRLLVSPHIVEMWNDVTEIKSREDDVMLCAYPKSGNHWVWEILTMLKTQSTQLIDKRMEQNGFLMMSPAVMLDALPSPRVLMTHRRFYELPSDFIINRRKLVCLLREPKDLCVSWYQMLKSLKVTDYDGKFDGFVKLFLDGHVLFNSWSHWLMSFEKGLKEHPELSVHVIHYEQLKADPVGEILRLAEYLDVPASIAKEVAAQTEFSKMKAAKEAGNNPNDCLYKDNKEIIYRIGEPGQWTQYFSKEEAEQFDAALCKQLNRSSLQPRL